MAQRYSVDIIAKVLGNSAVDKLNRSLGQAEQKSKRLNGALKGLGSILAGAAIAQKLTKVFNAAAGREDAAARLENLTKRFQQFSGIQRVAAASSRKFAQSQTETLSAYADLASRLGSTGASLKDISNIYEGFNTLLSVNRVSAQEAASAQLQLNQALGAGALQGEEFRAISEAAPQLLDAVAKQLGVARGELKGLASEGVITRDVLVQALTAIKNEGADQVEASLANTSGALKRYQAAVEELSVALGQKLLPAITPIIRGLTKLIEIFAGLPAPIQAAVVGIAALGAAVAVLAPALGLAATGLAALVPLLPGLLTVVGLAAPYLALAAGVTAIGVAAFGATKKLQDFKQKMKNTSGTSAELRARINELNPRLKELEAEVARGGRAGAVARKKYNELKVALDNLEGTYKIRIEIEEIFKGANLGDIKSSGYGRNENGLTYTVSGVTYDARTGKPVAKPPKPFSQQVDTPSSSGGGGGGSDEKDVTAELERQREQLERQLATSADLERSSENRLRLAEATTDEERLKAQYTNNVSDILSKYNGLIKESKSDLETTNLINAQNKELLAAQLDFKGRMSKLDEKAIEDAETLGDKLQAETFKRIGTAIEDSIVAGIESAIDGTKKLDEALQEIASNLLKDLGRLFIRAGVSSIAGPGGFGLPGFADGGIASAGTPALVGEKGPEIIIPSSNTAVLPFDDARDAIAGGDATVAEDAFAANAAALGETASLMATKAAQQEMSQMADGGRIEVDVNTVNVGGLDVVTQEQFQVGVRSAAKAAQQQMMSKLKNSPAYRAGVGI